MGDVEIVRKCALAMGFQQVADGASKQIWYDPNTPPTSGHFQGFHYNPLVYDAQAMALVKQFRMGINPWEQGYEVTVSSNESQNCRAYATDPDLNRAICLCAASLPQGKP